MGCLGIACLCMLVFIIVFMLSNAPMPPGTTFRSLVRPICLSFALSGLNVLLAHNSCSLTKYKKQSQYNRITPAYDMVAKHYQGCQMNS